MQKPTSLSNQTRRLVQYSSEVFDFAIGNGYLIGTWDALTDKHKKLWHVKKERLYEDEEDRVKHLKRLSLVAMCKTGWKFGSLMSAIAKTSPMMNTTVFSK